MEKSKSKQPESQNTPEQQDLKKVNLHVNEFGQIVRDVKTDDLNAFLNENVPDKKFTEDNEALK